MELLVDRSLGRHKVPDALRAKGFVVHTLFSLYGRAEERIADADFLVDAGKAGYVVLTKDTSIRHRPSELAVVVTHRVRVFALAGGNLTGDEQAARFVGNLPAIQRAAREPGPAIYAVHPDRIVRKFP